MEQLSERFCSTTPAQRIEINSMKQFLLLLAVLRDVTPSYSKNIGSNKIRHIARVIPVFSSLF